MLIEQVLEVSNCKSAGWLNFENEECWFLVEEMRETSSFTRSLEWPGHNFLLTLGEIVLRKIKSNGKFTVKIILKINKYNAQSSGGLENLT